MPQPSIPLRRWPVRASAPLIVPTVELFPAMPHNRRFLGLPIPGQNLWQACSEWIIGNATLRSCHKLRHSNQCIIERSRLVEQLAHHRIYDTKIYSNSYSEKIQITPQRSQTHHYTSGSKYSCLNNKIQIMA